jgi:hypothetical protein
MKIFMTKHFCLTIGFAAMLGLIVLLGAERLRANQLVITAAPSLINYQGHLRDVNGNAFTGPAALRFTLYDAETGGSNLWSETYQNVPINAGNFAVKLGSSTPLTASLFSGPTRYLQLSADLTNTNSN